MALKQEPCHAAHASGCGAGRINASCSATVRHQLDNDPGRNGPTCASAILVAKISALRTDRPLALAPETRFGTSFVNSCRLFVWLRCLPLDALENDCFAPRNKTRFDWRTRLPATCLLQTTSKWKYAHQWQHTIISLSSKTSSA
jgi:hypothetical protein